MKNGFNGLSGILNTANKNLWRVRSIETLQTNAKRKSDLKSNNNKRKKEHPQAA